MNTAIGAELEARKWVEKIYSSRSQQLESELLQGSLSINMSHFSGPQLAPTELLQNADDAFDYPGVALNSAAVIFEVAKNYLMVANNGACFTEQDVSQITNIGNPHKIPGQQSGWMDFGFKSVFQITDNPQVYSGPFKFGFRYDRSTGDVGGYLLPRWIDEIPESVVDAYRNGWTVFYLPLREDLPRLYQFCKAIDFSPLSLVFLRHLQSITIKTDDGIRNYEVSSAESGRVSVSEYFDGTDSTFNRTHDFRIFTKTVEIPDAAKDAPRVRTSRRNELDKTDVALAVHIDEDGNIAPEPGKLFYFVPTTINTGLPFDINGDFFLNSDRTEVDQSLYWNEILFDGLKELFIEAITEWRKHPKWKYQFYGLIPDPDHCVVPVDQFLAEPVVTYCQSNDIVLTKSGRLVKPSMAVIAPARIHQVVDLQNWDDRGFLHPGIDSIPAVSAVDRLGAQDKRESEGHLLLEYIDHFKDRGMPYAFIHKLYDYLSKVVFGDIRDNPLVDRAHLQNEIKKRHIVPIERGTRTLPQAATYPLSNRFPRVRKSLISNLLFVKSSFATRKNKRLFTEHLKVPELSESEIITRLLNDRNKSKWTVTKKRDAFDFFHSWLARRDWVVPGDIQPRIGRLPIRTTMGWIQANECYFQSPLSVALFRDRGLVDHVGVSEEHLSTYKALGVSTWPQVELVDLRLPYKMPLGSGTPFTSLGSYTADTNAKRLFGSKLTGEEWDHYCKWLWDVTDINRKTRDQDISGIPIAPWLNSFHTLTDQLLSSLVETIGLHWTDYYSRFRESEYRFFYRTDRKRVMPSLFMYKLKSQAWLPTTKGRLQPGNHIFSPTAGNLKVIGDLLPFVNCGQAAPDHQSMNSFFRAIDVSVLLNKESLLAGIKFIGEADYISTVSDWFTADRAARLSDIYRTFVDALTPEDTHWGYVKLLARDNTFRDASELSWDANQDLVNMFGDSYPIAWMPRMERRLQERLCSFFKIRRISDEVSSQVIPGNQQDKSKWETVFGSKKNFLYSFFADRLGHDVDAVSAFLAGPVRIEVRSSLHVEWSLEDSTIIKKTSAYFDKAESTLWIDHETADEAELAYAFAQAFDLHDSVEQIELILSADNSKLRSRFERWQVTVLELEPATTGLSPDSEIEILDGSVATTSSHFVTKAPNIEIIDIHNDYEGANAGITGPRPTSQRIGDRTYVIEPRSSRPSSDTRDPDQKSLVRGVDMVGESDAATRKAVEMIGMRTAEWIEKHLHRRVVDDVHRWESYDLLSWLPEDKEGTLKYIEVKTRFSQRPVILTDAEHDVATEKREDYWLYVVTPGPNDAEISIYCMQDPVNSQGIEINEKLTPLWQVYGWAEEIEPLVVSTIEIGLDSAEGV